MATRRIMCIAKGDVRCERLGNGAYRCTAIVPDPVGVGNRLLHCDYYGYPKAEAIRKFRSNPPR